jgi:hypothetical protein
MAKRNERKDEYYLASTHVIDGVTCNVYRPILTDYQRKLREEMVKDALAEFGRCLFERGEFDCLQDGFTEEVTA